MTENIGGYDHYSFNESSGNRILEDFLEKGESIKTHFAVGDKGPNFDGYFYLLEDRPTKQVATARINVQIKTIESDYTNNNKGKKEKFPYKYLCDTKIFNAVNRAITLDPTILFLVDIKQKKAFWIYLSEQLIFDQDVEDKESTTVFFSEDNALHNLTAFISAMQTICREKRELLKDGPKNRLLTATSDPDIIKQLQIEVDKINNLFDNDLRFIRDRWFCDVWKFGLAFSTNNGFTYIGLYKIRLGEEGFYFKDFSRHDDYQCFMGFNEKHKSIDAAVNEIVFGFVHDFFIKSFIEPEILPTIVLEEIAFSFLDLVPRICKDYEKEGFPCVYYKDQESVAVLTRLWDAVIEVGFGIASDKKIAIFDPVAFLTSSFTSEKSPYTEKFRELANDENFKRTRYPFDLVLKGKFGYNLFIRTIAELKKRSVKVVNRIWRHEDYLNFSNDLEGLTGFNRFETGYKISDYSFNIHRFLTKIAQSYFEVAPKFFGKSLDCFPLKRRTYFSFSNDTRFHYVKVVEKSEQLEIIDVNDFDHLESIVQASSVKARESYGALVSRASGILDDFRDRLFLYDGIANLLYLAVCKHFEIEKETKHFLDF